MEHYTPSLENSVHEATNHRTILMPESNVDDSTNIKEDKPQRRPVQEASVDIDIKLRKTEMTKLVRSRHMHTALFFPFMCTLQSAIQRLLVFCRLDYQCVKEGMGHSLPMGMSCYFWT